MKEILEKWEDIANNLPPIPLLLFTITVIGTILALYVNSKNKKERKNYGK